MQVEERRIIGRFNILPAGEQSSGRGAVPASTLSRLRECSARSQQGGRKPNRGAGGPAKLRLGLGLGSAWARLGLALPTGVEGT